MTIKSIQPAIATMPTSSTMVTVVTAGVILSAAGEAIAFIPNALGRALLHNERLTYYSPVSNIRDRRMTEKCLHQGWVIGNILQLRIHSALQIFARLQR